MARYFLHLRTPTGLIPDKEGIELIHLGDLRKSGAAIAADLIGENPAAADWNLEVSDELDRTVLTERLGALITGKKPSA